MNPSHDNTQDPADLEIARLKAELAAEIKTGREQGWAALVEARAELSRLTEDYTTLKVAIDHVSGALCDSGEVVPEDCRKYGETVRGIVQDRLRTATQNARLTEENRKLRRLLAATTEFREHDLSECRLDWTLNAEHCAACRLNKEIQQALTKTEET